MPFYTEDTPIVRQNILQFTFLQVKSLTLQRFLTILIVYLKIKFQIMNFSDDLGAESSLSYEVQATQELDNLDPEGWLSTNVEATEESENESVENKSILKFDPKLIKITVETVTIYGLAQRLKLNQIDLYPKFQRRANLWEPVRQSRLIESLLLRFPLPAFYFDIQDESKWLVVDGLQRLSTLKHFIVEPKEPLLLTGLEILTDLEGKSFKQLDITLRQRILNTNITTFQIQAGTPKEVKYNIFKRINTGALVLTPMEIRHALNQNGSATQFFEQLTGQNDGFFNTFIKNNKITTLRMEDRELVLRYIAFSLNEYKDYQTGLGKFLDKAMEQLDNLKMEDCHKHIVNLEKSINCYEAIFGNTRFGRGFTLRANMNSALFEVWTSELARLTDRERALLISKNESIVEKYRAELSDTTFNKSIISSTAGKGAVETRFNRIHQLIHNHL